MVKSNIFENEDEIRNSILANVMGQSKYVKRDFSSQLEKNLFLNGGIDFSTNNFFFKLSSNTTFTKTSESSDKKFSSAISILLYKARVKIPLSSIKIKKSIEEKIEKIIFGEVYKELSFDEKKNLIREYLEDYGLIIPTTMVIGARYNYLIESNSKAEIDNFELDTKNKFGCALGNLSANVNFGKKKRILPHH